jgi:hypothetical protein
VRALHPLRHGPARRPLTRRPRAACGRDPSTPTVTVRDMNGSSRAGAGLPFHGGHKSLPRDRRPHRTAHGRAADRFVTERQGRRAEWPCADSVCLADAGEEKKGRAGRPCPATPMEAAQ